MARDYQHSHPLRSRIHQETMEACSVLSVRQSLSFARPNESNQRKGRPSSPPLIMVSLRLLDKPGVCGTRGASSISEPCRSAVI